LSKFNVTVEQAAFIIENFGDDVTPEQLVVEASDPKSILNNLFTWDPDKAIAKCHLMEARQVIRGVKVMWSNEKHNVTYSEAPYYVHDPDKSNESGYVSTASLVGDEERKRRVLKAETDRIRGGVKRARELAERFGLSSELTKELREIVKE